MVHPEITADRHHETDLAEKAMSAAPAVALTIAGSDSSGGAGIQADLKTFAAFGVYGASAITALTAQNTVAVRGVQVVPVAFMIAQMDAVLDDLPVAAIKTGMLASTEIVIAVADRLTAVPTLPLVVDPVMVATSGDSLLEPAAIAAYRQRLIPRATLLTPNLAEAARLLDAPLAVSPTDMADQARALLQLGAGAVLLKGGHGGSATATDILATADRIVEFSLARIETSSTHGTGCTLAAAIAALLAQGIPLEEAARRAKTYVWQAIDAARHWHLGQGHGPLDHHYAQRSGPPPA
jgi:hydroxymethylpyrimidine/phosphomethylpyrimidine kinase